MSDEEIKIFQEKADAFLDTGMYNFKKKRYDLAAFHIEQAVQLYVKTKLLEVAGEFPRTHNLVALLNELAKINGKEIGRFAKDNLDVLTKLADVYITSRYYTREFYGEEVKGLFDFVQKIEVLLEYD